MVAGQIGTGIDGSTKYDAQLITCVEAIKMIDKRHSPNTPAKGSRSEADTLSDHIGQNVEDVVELQRRDWETVTPSQRRLERVSRFVARPLYLLGILWIVALWIIINSGAAVVGFAPMDAAPFQWLQGLLTLVALLTTTIVLIAQNRQTKLEQQRAHLAL